MKQEKRLCGCRGRDADKCPDLKLHDIFEPDEGLSKEERHLIGDALLMLKRLAIEGHDRDEVNRILNGLGGIHPWMKE